MNNGELPTELWVIHSGEGFPDLADLIADAWYPGAPVSRVLDGDDDLTDCTMLDLKLDKWLVDPSWRGNTDQDVWMRASMFWPPPRSSDGRIEDPFVIDAMRARQHDAAIRVRIDRPCGDSIDTRAFLRMVARLAEDSRGIVLDPANAKEWDPASFRSNHSKILDTLPTLGRPPR